MINNYSSCLDGKNEQLPIDALQFYLISFFEYKSTFIELLTFF